MTISTQLCVQLPITLETTFCCQILMLVHTEHVELIPVEWENREISIFLEYLIYILFMTKMLKILLFENLSPPFPLSTPIVSYRM